MGQKCLLKEFEAHKKRKKSAVGRVSKVKEIADALLRLDKLGVFLELGGKKALRRMEDSEKEG